MQPTQRLPADVRARAAQRERETEVPGYTDNTKAAMMERASAPLAAELADDDEFPQGPASRSVATNHMESAGYSAELLAEARAVLTQLEIG